MIENTNTLKSLEICYFFIDHSKTKSGSGGRCRFQKLTYLLIIYRVIIKQGKKLEKMIL